MSDDNDETYDLEMPFVPVRSRGGPFDDDAYVCGYEMGLLDGELRACPPAVLLVQKMIHEDNVKQADLVAMRNNFSASFDEPHMGWVYARFEPAEHRLDEDAL